MRNRPRPQEIYRHFKGKRYQIVSLAEHSETGEELVIYQALYDDYRIFARPLAMFMEEIGPKECRFQLIEKNESDVAPAIGEDISDTKASELSAAEMKTSETKTSEINEAELLGIDPLVLEFLAAESYDKRLQVLTILQPRITDSMINTMAVSLDLEIADGEIEKRYDELKHCLLTMKKFEINR